MLTMTRCLRCLRCRGVTLLLGWLVLAPLASAGLVLDREAFAEWSDQVFGSAWAERRFSGLVIAVVADDEVVFTRGYGHAEPRTGAPMDPADTLVRIGSVTKVFTAVAIAQLLETGAIGSLDDPANHYLRRLQLPRAFGQDISLWHLLTHRAGFADTAFGMANLEPPVVPVPADVIRRYMPPIVRPPGSEAVYSNFSTALLGIVVEDITGLTLQDYLEQNVLEPLHMDRSRLSYATEPPAQLATPHAYFPNGESQPVRYVGVHPLIAPAGAMVTTALDMTRFMRALLRAGDDPEPVLTPALVAMLLERHAGNHPEVSGFGMKFITGHWNGERHVGHGGGWPGFQTVMELFPDSGIGVFIAIAGGEPLVNLEEQLLGSARLNDRREPPVERAMQLMDARQLLLTRLLGEYQRPFTTDAVELSAFTGSYWRERRAFHSLEALFQLLNAGTSILDVKIAGDGSLAMNGVAGFRPVSQTAFLKPGYGPSLTGDPNANELFAFHLSAGRAQLAAPLLSVDVWQRTSPWWNPVVVMKLLLILAAVAATGVLAAGWPVGRGASVRGASAPSAETVAKWLPVICFLCLLGIPLVLLAGYAEEDGLMWALLLGRPGRFALLLLLTNLLAALALAMVVFALLAWRRQYWGEGLRARLRRCHYSLLAVASAALIPCLHHANLLGVHWP